MPLSKQIEQQPPTSPHTPQHVQQAPQKPSAARPRCTCACCIPGACACLVLGMGKQETPCCRNPLLFWEERMGGGKAWPGLPVTLQNSFKAQQCKRELGSVWLFGCRRLWSLQSLLPEVITQAQAQGQPAATCQRGMGAGPAAASSAAPPVKHSLHPASLPKQES